MYQMHRIPNIQLPQHSPAEETSNEVVDEDDSDDDDDDGVVELVEDDH